MARVTAGLSSAPDSELDTYAATITAKPQPKAMAIHPAPWALDFFSVTAAHTPPPSRISSAVPSISPKKMWRLDTWTPSS